MRCRRLSSISISAPGNMMFGGERGIMLIDWQGACLGQGTYDVSRLIELGLELEVRANSELALVQEYYNELKSEGAEFGPWDRFLRQYERGKLEMLPMGVLDVTYDRSGFPEDQREVPLPDLAESESLWRKYVEPEL